MGDIADWLIDQEIFGDYRKHHGIHYMPKTYYEPEPMRPLKPSEVTNIAEAHFDSTSQKTKDLNKGVIKW